MTDGAPSRKKRPELTFCEERAQREWPSLSQKEGGHHGLKPAGSLILDPRPLELGEKCLCGHLVTAARAKAAGEARKVPSVPRGETDTVHRNQRPSLVLRCPSPTHVPPALQGWPESLALH